MKGHDKASGSGSDRHQRTHRGGYGQQTRNGFGNQANFGNQGIASVQGTFGPQTTNFGPQTTNFGPQTTNLGPQTTNFGPTGGSQPFVNRSHPGIGIYTAPVRY